MKSSSSTVWHCSMHRAICRALMLVCVLFVALPPAAAAELLREFPGHTGGGRGNDEINSLTYTLFFGGPPDPFPIPPWPNRLGELSYTAFSASPLVVPFTSMNAPGFMEFASLATNGDSNDVLVDGVEEISHLSGSYSSSTEEALGWASLSTYQLDEVRLVLSHLSISSDKKAFETSYSWQFWGHAVPEPASGTCAAMLCAMILARRQGK
jgi:hypothetical protein